MAILLGIFEEGLIYAIMALGVYITYKILDFPDLSVDGTFPLGAALTAGLIVKGISPVWALTALFLRRRARRMRDRLYSCKMQGPRSVFRYHCHDRSLLRKSSDRRNESQSSRSCPRIRSSTMNGRETACRHP